jgi:glycosyltransferase involved in cell wall biosynthesis
VTVVVCSHRSVRQLERSIPAWLAHGIKELIVVDAFSDDGTTELLEGLRVTHGGRLRVIEAPLLGLAHARRTGTEAASGDIVLHAGPDNVVPAPTLAAMLARLSTHDLISCRTVLGQRHGYLDWAQEVSKRRLPAGEITTTVGTPSLARAALYAAHPFDTAMRFADDKDFCERIRADGHTIWRCEETCLEYGVTTLADVRRRWLMYGAGDAQFYAKMRDGWTLRRRLRSRMRPFIAELGEPWPALDPLTYLRALPFFLLVATLRWAGWMREEWRTRAGRVAHGTGGTTA